MRLSHFFARVILLQGTIVFVFEPCTGISQGHLFHIIENYQIIILLCSYVLQTELHNVN